MKYWLGSSSPERLFTIFISLAVLLLVWALIFQVDKSVQAAGEISPLGRAAVIQSSYPGRVQEIAISLNAKVKKGDLLLLIDSQDERLQLSELVAERLATEILVSRLMAQSALTDILPVNGEWPKYLVEDQQRVLATAIDSHKKRLQSLDREKQKNNKELQAHLAELNAQYSAIELSKQRLALVKTLYEKGFEGELALLEARQKLEEEERKRLELESRAATFELEIDRLILEEESEITNFKRDAVTELSEARKTLDALKLKIANLNDRIAAYSIRAPETGVVSKLNINYVGDLVASGDVVAELIPQGTPLVFYARIPVESIDDVAVGQKAKVTLSTMNAKSDVPYDGVVELIESDATTEDDGSKYYKAVIRIETASSTGSKILPGVTGSVALLLGTRTVAEYFLEPIYDALRGSLNESS